MRIIRINMALLTALLAGCGLGPSAGGNVTEAATTTGSTGDTGAMTVTPTTGSVVDLGAADDGSCDVWQQDCPEGEKCVPSPREGENAWSEARCAPLFEEVLEAGDSCITLPWPSIDTEAIDNCVEGTLCWSHENRFTVLPYACIPQCSGGPEEPQCPPGQACNVRDGQLALCERIRCDPTYPWCLDGRSCVFDGVDDFRCVPGPAVDGTGFSPCEMPTDCAPGQLCAAAELAPGFCQADSASCCLPVCDLDFPACNAEPLVCVPFFAAGTAPPEHANVGVCGVT
jgi:hypothetical protein